MTKTQGRDMDTAAAENQATESQGDDVYVYSRIVSALRGPLTTDEIASVVGTSPRQVQNWAAGRNKPASSGRDNLLEVHYLVERLGDVYQPEGVEIWLHARNRNFGGERPLDLLEAGEFRRVLAAVERLTEGTPE